MIFKKIEKVTETFLRLADSGCGFLREMKVFFPGVRKNRIASGKESFPDKYQNLIQTLLGEINEVIQSENSLSIPEGYSFIKG